MATRKLEVVITGDSSGARRALNDVDNTAGKTGSSITAKLKGSLSSVSGFGTALAGGLLGGGLVAGFTGLQAAVTGIVSEYQESVKAGAETERVIRTTGGAANVTAGQVENLAQRLSEKRGVDDELIQSGANLLLTFTNIRNEAGKGNDVFNQSVKLSGDMATSLGISVPAAAKMLGKALNDPVAGAAKLARAGVMLTAQQKEQIAVMVRVGDTLGAQKVILDAVGEKYRGAAEAAATPIDKLKVKLANLQEDIGRFFAEKAMPWIAEMWPEVQAKVEAGIARVQEIIEPALEIIEVLWHQFGDNILNFLEGAWNSIRLVVQGALNVIQGIINVVLGILTGDWSRAWDGIKGIVSGVWELIKGIVGAALNWVNLAVGIAWESLTRIAGAAWDGIKGVISDAWDGIKSAAGAALGALEWIIGIGVNIALAPIRAAVDAMGFVWGLAWGGLSGAVQGALNLISPVIDTIVRLIDTVLGPLRELRDLASGSWATFSTGGGGDPNDPVIKKFIQNAGLRASGGPVTAGMPYIVGERRPELFIPNSNGRIAPSVPTMSSGGGNNYQISVTVAPGGNPADTGRAVVESIKEFERRAGSSWRN